MLVLMMFGLLQNVLFPIETEHTVEKNIWIACFNIEALQIRGGLTYPLAFPRLSSLTLLLYTAAKLQCLKLNLRHPCVTEKPQAFGETLNSSQMVNLLLRMRKNLWKDCIYRRWCYACIFLFLMKRKKRQAVQDNGKHEKCGNLWHFPYFHVWENRNWVWGRQRGWLLVSIDHLRNALNTCVKIKFCKNMLKATLISNISTVNRSPTGDKTNM